MDPVLATRFAAGVELQKLAEEFERSDEAAFRRARVGCTVVSALAALVVLVLLLAGVGWQGPLGFLAVVLVLSWGAYALSARRQRAQVEQLLALARRWQQGDGTTSAV